MLLTVIKLNSTSKWDHWTVMANFIQGKMSNDRNKTLDCKATKIVALVNNDLANAIQPLPKDGSKYVISFIDYYSGLTMLYFLKHKSDTFLATTKYLTSAM